MSQSNLAPAYEIRNPSFNDMTLEQQIAAGVNDWCAESRNGHEYYGETKQKAEELRDALGRYNPNA